MFGELHQSRIPGAPAVSCGIVLAAALALAGATPRGLRVRPPGHSTRWRVSLQSTKPCPSCPAGVSFTFAVNDRLTGALTHFTLAPTYMARVNEVRATPAGTAVIITSHGPYGPPDTATVVALPGGRVEDTFGCVWPALSPDARFLAFRKWFPLRYPPGVLVDDEYLVYDMTKGPEYNRSGCGTRPHCDAGLPIYPPGAQNNVGMKVAEGAAIRNAHAMVSRRFFWLETNTVGFVDRWRDVNSLVVADLSGGVRHPRVTVREIDTSRVVDFAGCADRVAPSDLEQAEESPGTLIYVQDIQKVPGKPGWVRLTLLPNECLKTTTFDMKVRDDVPDRNP